MKKLLAKLQLGRMLKKLYKLESFWRKFNFEKRDGEPSMREQFIKAMESHLLAIEDKKEFIEYLEYRIVMYLKDMDFINEADTKENRAKLKELLSIKQHIERLMKDQSEAMEEEKEKNQLTISRKG